MNLPWMTKTRNIFVIVKQDSLNEWIDIIGALKVFTATGIRRRNRYETSERKGRT